MALPSTEVRYISTGTRGAPGINGLPGSFLAFLRAFLKDGWGPLSPVSVTVLDGLATATFPVSDPFLPHAVVSVTNMDDHNMNGVFRVESMSGNVSKWRVEASDGVKSGAATVKYAPVDGWTEVFTGTNVAAFRSLDIRASGFYLRVDDSTGQSCRVRGFESMTSVSAGTGPFPTDAMVSGGDYINHALAANSTATRAFFIADPAFLVLGVSIASPGFALWGFGDPVSMNPIGDPYACFLSASPNSSATSQQQGQIALTSYPNSAGFAVARAPGAGVGAVRGSPQSVGAGSGPSMGLIATVGNERPILLPRWVSSNTPTANPGDTTGEFRGLIPGLYSAAQRDASALSTAPAGAFMRSGEKVFHIVPTATSINTTVVAPGVQYIDAIGPWR